MMADMDTDKQAMTETQELRALHKVIEGRGEMMDHLGNPYLEKQATGCNFGIRLMAAFSFLGVQTLGDLTHLTVRDFTQLPNVGKVSTHRLSVVLAMYGLALKQKRPSDYIILKAARKLVAQQTLSNMAGKG